MIIRVPATSANLGPGFDSIGLAVTRYLTLEVLEATDQWQVDHDFPDIPHDEQHMCVQVALSILPDLPPHHVRMSSEIPIARGLGSSSSVIVAGIELANQLGQMQLSPQQKLEKATQIEGHPDNVAPAIFGNLVIASSTEKSVEAIVAPMPTCDLVAFIPRYSLKTTDSRAVLPESLSYREAVLASSTANILVAALLQGDLSLAGRAMASDRFHQPYRRALVKEYPMIEKLAHDHGAYATYLSGAGPTVMVLCPPHVTQKLMHVLAQEKIDGDLVALSVDTNGVVVIP